MKRKKIALARRYAEALRQHLQDGTRGSPQSALALGRQAAGLGLETLALARIHEQALVTLKLSHSKNGVLKRAQIFFTEAVIPILNTHRTVRQSNASLNRLNETLDQRTLDLTATNLKLQEGIARHQALEDAFKKSRRDHNKSLEESLELQKRLRQLTHRVLAAQEDDRKQISQELQDEIAQTLLGINVRLLSLKRESQSNTKDFKNEIASTQRLVVKSARSVRKFARKLGNP